MPTTFAKRQKEKNRQDKRRDKDAKRDQRKHDRANKPLANVSVTFRITSMDVIHGFEIAGTNANAMAIPGYVSQFTVTFPKAGQYSIVCNEFCGLMHHMMVGHVTVK